VDRARRGDVPQHRGARLRRDPRAGIASKFRDSPQDRAATGAHERVSQAAHGETRKTSPSAPPSWRALYDFPSNISRTRRPQIGWRRMSNPRSGILKPFSATLSDLRHFGWISLQPRICARRCRFRSCPSSLLRWKTRIAKS